MSTSYVIQDRDVATRWALSVSDGQTTWESTVTGALAEPVVVDLVTGQTRIVFMSDGQLGSEVGVAAPALCLLRDTVTGTYWQLVVSDGQLGWLEIDPSDVGIGRAILRRRRR